MTQRVEIPAYTDRWMMGDRFGEVIKTYDRRIRVAGGTELRTVAKVRLDTSGKLVSVRG